MTISKILKSFFSTISMADDLEIYLGVAGSQVTYDPNILFIMDTSGSMTDKDGGSESRMLRVQNALKQTLSSVTNVNAGLMRFSDYGGPVLYPIRPIDDAVKPEIITSISSGNDDAYQIGSTVNTNASTLKVSEGTSSVLLGLRYQNLNIPRGATITGAYLRFTSSAFNTGATDITFSAELAGNSAAFATSSNNLSSRTKTNNSVLWNTSNDWPISGETIASPDLTSIIQEVVDQGTWCGGNALSLLINSVGGSASSARKAVTSEEGLVADRVFTPASVTMIAEELRHVGNN